MNEVLLQLDAFGVAIIVTPWKIVGYVGVGTFAGRWFVQVWASHHAREPTVPRLFWYMSLTGSLLLLTYFVFGRNDSVGVLSNLFPAVIAGYNLMLDYRKAAAPVP